MTGEQPYSSLPGETDYARGLRDLSPDTWANAFCSSGEYHVYRRKFLRRPVCTLCGHRRPY